jgi:hypothetical protein
MSNLGRPSADGKITLYTKEECSLLNGNWHSNGECLKKEGGSYSWDNRPNSKNTHVNLQFQLADSTVQYSNIKNVLVTDLSGNILFVSNK